MKDFKKMPKMACGGGVKKYQAGGDVLSDFRATQKPLSQETLDKKLPVYKGKIGPDGQVTRPEMSPDMKEKSLPVFRGKIGPNGQVVKPEMDPEMRKNMLMKTGGKVKRGKVTKK